MKNEYFLMRHGQSKNNIPDIVVSDMQKGDMQEYGLTEKGEKQIYESIKENKELFDEDTIIVTSPFLRCKQSAEIVQKILGSSELIVEEKLRERELGECEGRSRECYTKIWEKDKTDVHNTEMGVESPQSVLDRAYSVIEELEYKFDNKKIIIVSHCDVLQILLTKAKGLLPSQHREIEHMKNAHIRKFSSVLQ